jgi:hypothetical protein
MWAMIVKVLHLGLHANSCIFCNDFQNFFPSQKSFETNDSDITFIKRRFDAKACIIFKL